jgi:hypothetical protein
MLFEDPNDDRNMKSRVSNERRIKMKDVPIQSGGPHQDLSRLFLVISFIVEGSGAFKTITTLVV